MTCTRTLALLLALIAATLASAENRHDTPCVDGMAGGFPCHRVDLLANVGLDELGAVSGNDIWGWTDPVTGIEYALLGLNNGTAFVRLDPPDHPVVVGTLPTQSVNSLWRDIKVYDDHAYIVSEAAGHGLQVFDLRRLRAVAQPPVTFSADTVYSQFQRAHNIAINEDSGYAYAVGSRQGPQQCNGGLHMIDLAQPQQPTFAGCFAADGYTHDTQCVRYAGPDHRYTGQEICFSSNENTLTIVDVSDKSQPVQLSRTPYTGSAYAHQGWLTEDQRWFLMNDELDEVQFGHNTTTLFWDVADLTAPVLAFRHVGPVAASDHNLYVRGQHAYLANYRSGLRILDLAGIEQHQVEEIAWFDTYPEDDLPGFRGAWSSYPFFASGVVVVGDINRGLFVLRPRLCTAPDAVGGLVAQAAGDQHIELSWTPDADPDVRYEVWRELGGCAGGPGDRIAGDLHLPTYSDLGVSGQVAHGYRIRAVAPSGECSSTYSACVEATTSGACTAPPQFAGLDSVESPGLPVCRLDLQWPAAPASCDGPVRYDVHRSLDASFEPADDNRIARDLDQTRFQDNDLIPDLDHHYLVRARDLGNGISDGNQVRLGTLALGPPADGTWISGAEVGEPILDSGSGRHVAWHVVDDVVHSGERSYASGYINGECIALSTGELRISDGETARLRFHTRYGIETGWDGGIVQISADGGASWQSLSPDGGYPATITGAGNACALPVGTGVFGGERHDWHEQQFDLDGYSGDIRLRWLFSTDDAVADLGWWIDDIAIEHIQVPGACVALADDRLFADDFELAR